MEEEAGLEWPLWPTALDDGFGDTNGEADSWRTIFFFLRVYVGDEAVKSRNRKTRERKKMMMVRKK